jgi:hypothetical protein
MAKRTFWLICLLALSCKKNPHVSKSEIEQLTSAKVEKILAQKKYQLDDSASFEDVTLFETGGKTALAVFTPTEKSYALLRQYAWQQAIAEPKIFFIGIGNKKSQVLITHGSAEKTLNLFDARDFMQEFIPRSAETANVKITKTEEKPHDELLALGKTNYRFNGVRWIPYGNDEIFPYIETFSVAGEQSLIEIVNRGQFGTRVNLTLAFTDVTAAETANKLKLLKNIPTVHIYKPGFPAHKNGGGTVALPYPLIEIRKDSWPKNGRIKLPLFMKDIQHFTLRAVYSQRGHNFEWPAGAAHGIVKDGQGYWAMEK